MARVRLTKKELTTETGEELLKLLLEITHDGELTEQEVQHLQAWVEQHGAELPGATYLREILDAIMLDRKVSMQDRWDLLHAIQKVLPTAEREAVKIRTRNVQEPATERQLQFLKVLGVTHPEDVSKWDASALIDEALNRRDESRRGDREPREAEPERAGRSLVIELGTRPAAKKEPSMIWFVLGMAAAGWIIAQLLSGR